jgi:hypothetical protein
MSRSRIGVAILALGALLLVLVWQVAPPLAPPLYDGLIGPAERYRYLTPPEGYRPTKPPTSTHTTIDLTGSPSPLMVASTGEQPPQAQLILEDGAIPGHPHIPRVTLSIKPVAPPGTPPDGSLDSNVYRFAVTAPSGRTVQFSRRATVSIRLRPATTNSNPVVERYTGGRWVSIKTHHFVGLPFYSADIRQAGTYALVTPGTGGSALPWTLILIAAIAVLLVVVLLLLIRFARRPQPTP